MEEKHLTPEEIQNITVLMEVGARRLTEQNDLVKSTEILSTALALIQKLKNVLGA